MQRKIDDIFKRKRESDSEVRDEEKREEAAAEPNKRLGRLLTELRAN